jgi:hypothetical protein
VPSHHHDAEKARKSASPQRLRHWKVKEWKRRTTLRKAKAEQHRLAAEQA